MRAKHPVSVLVLGALLIAPAVAHALPEFPQAVQDATGAPCLPQCNLCHRDVSGGGVIDQPFGESIRKNGLRGEESIPYAVDSMKQNNVDSDGDGVGDIDELSQGKDPNNAYDALICLPDVGCGAHVAPSIKSNGVDAGIAALFTLGLALFRRRRRS